MPNVIKQIVKNGNVIKMTVRENERGPQGEKGDTGMAAIITAGNAYSVAAGQSPAVINTGTSSAAVFDFYIPKGDKGDTGEAPIIMTTEDPGEGASLEAGHFLAVYEP